MLKKLLSLVVAAICICSFSANTYAAETSAPAVLEISPRYSYTISTTSVLTTSGKSATCESSITANFEVTKIVINQYLQKKSGSSWGTVPNGSWTKTVNTFVGSAENTKSSLSSGTYRLKTVFTVTTKTGQSETVTVYSAEKII